MVLIKQTKVCLLQARTLLVCHGGMVVACTFKVNLFIQGGAMPSWNHLNSTGTESCLESVYLIIALGEWWHITNSALVFNMKKIHKTDKCQGHGNSVFPVSAISVKCYLAPLSMDDMRKRMTNFGMLAHSFCRVRSSYCSLSGSLWYCHTWRSISSHRWSIGPKRCVNYALTLSCWKMTLAEFTLGTTHGP